MKQNANNRVDHNFIHGNNKPNTCLDPSEEVCAVPQGSGLLVLAADANAIDHNVVLDIEPNSDFDRVTFNVASGNGTAPSPLINPLFAVDLAWDTTGTGNCWQHNAAGTQVPPDLPSCH